MIPLLEVVPLVPSARLYRPTRVVEGGDERRRKFIKYLKVRKRLLSPGAINFHLHFIFVSFATLDNGELRGGPGDTVVVVMVEERGEERRPRRRGEKLRDERGLFFPRDLLREQGCGI